MLWSANRIPRLCISRPRIGQGRKSRFGSGSLFSQLAPLGRETIRRQTVGRKTSGRLADLLDRLPCDGTGRLRFNGRHVRYFEPGRSQGWGGFGALRRQDGRRAEALPLARIWKLSVLKNDDLGATSTLLAGRCPATQPAKDRQNGDDAQADQSAPRSKIIANAVLHKSPLAASSLLATQNGHLCHPIKLHEMASWPRRRHLLESGRYSATPASHQNTAQLMIGRGSLAALGKV